MKEFKVWASLALALMLFFDGYTMAQGVFRSRNGGDTWAAINTGLTHPFIFTLAIDPLVPSTLYAGTYNFARRVFQSRDGEDTWAANSPLSCFSEEGGT